MNRIILNQIELPPEPIDQRTGYFLPIRTIQDRGGFLTILKLREIKRRRRRTTDSE
ncbi:MAG TPA: hypothetical protein VL361_07160 [Candidatus Limnocylindrales bacterium]|jgi:hypothetical protein|nr:hypothetical protein [Candidatus Limnocylindrales bacterium]